MAGIKMDGFKEFIAACRDEDLIGQPARNYLDRSVLSIQNKARYRAPVDRGQLRKAIDHQIDPSPIPEWGEAGIIAAPDGSPLWEKASIMEYGAGTLADGGPFAGGPYKPEVTDDLHLWAKRHGFVTEKGEGDGWAVADFIAKKGGISPRHYLRDGFKSAFTEINNKFLKQMWAEILERWEAKGK